MNYKFFNKILVAFQVVLFVFLWVYAIVNYTSLPEKIPQHYGIDGKPDIYGSKNTIFVLSFIGSILFLFLNQFSKNTNSEVLNVSPKIKIKPELTKIFINVILLFVLLLFSRILYEEINVINGLQDGLSYIIPVIIVAMLFFVIGFNVYFHFKK